jgi:hypothetical protein
MPKTIGIWDPHFKKNKWTIHMFCDYAKCVA